MKKRKVLLGSIIIGIFLLSGCIGDNSRPPSYPSRYSERDIDVELKYDSPVFYFGDVVQDDGSVNQSKTVNWTLTINNRGNHSEDVRFEIAYFPPDLLIWSTCVTYKFGEIIYPEYDYEDKDFERYNIEDIISMASVEFTVSITFDKTVAWSYSPDTTYVGYFEIGRRTINPKCGNIGYGELIVPFVVRT